jgi:hypothetical protein
MKTHEPISQRFQRDIATHQIEIRHNDGLYRHIVFKRPDTVCMAFSLTTTPGRLIYAGDMGCFVFERVTDMFDFFRSRAGHRDPNLGYWHEKLVAIDRCGSQENSVDRFRDNLKSYDTAELTEAQQQAVAVFITEACGTYEEEGPDAAYRLVRDFELEDDRPHHREFFTDFFEHSDRVYSIRYEWACHAIQWGVQQYDKATANAVEFFTEHI